MKLVRAAAHMHSEFSDDGSWSLPDIAAAFAKRGYDVVLLTDHSRGMTAAGWDDYRAACADASAAGILLVPGVEYNDPDNVVHIGVWGDVPFYEPQPHIPDLLGKAAADGASCVLNHPWRRDAWRRFDASWTPHLTAVEVWNRKYNGYAPDARAVRLARAHGLREFVALDFHTWRQFFPLAMQLRLDTDAVDRDAVYRALRSGAFEPLAFGRPAGRLLSGPGLGALQAVELARRTAAKAMRPRRR